MSDYRHLPGSDCDCEIIHKKLNCGASKGTVHRRKKGESCPYVRIAKLETLLVQLGVVPEIGDDVAIALDRMKGIVSQWAEIWKKDDELLKLTRKLEDLQKKEEK